MNIFIVGLPVSGRTTVAKTISNNLGFFYIDSASWLKSTFRDQNVEESDQQYTESYNTYLVNRLKLDPDLFSRNIKDIIKSSNDTFIIDGLLNPRDFIQLFNYNEDVVVFLNRTDNEAEYKDNENIAISVIRDYCFWVASLKLLSRERWMEFNFTIPGDPANDLVKKLGTHNSVFLVKSIRKVISLIEETLVNS